MAGKRSPPTPNARQEEDRGPEGDGRVQAQERGFDQQRAAPSAKDGGGEG